MPLKRQFTHCMLRPEDVAPHADGAKVVGAFNPAAAPFGDEVVLVVRIVEEVSSDREGYVVSPVFRSRGQLQLDYLEADHHDHADPRKYIHKTTGITRLRFYSYLKVFYSKDGTTIDREGPIILPEGRYEEYGVEDPRLTKIGNTYYFTYVGVSKHGCNTCLMSTTDFKSFQRHGIIFVAENKDTLLFPEKIFGEYIAMQRPVPHMQFTPPEIWLARSPDLIHWGNHQQLLGAELSWQNSRIGGGTPPIKTREGWLTFYHGSEKRPDEPVGRYTAGLLLLDAQQPGRILGHSPDPVMVPEEEFELGGYVANVVFPTGIVERDDLLYVYYGAADTKTGVVGYRREDVMAAIQRVG